MIKQTVYIDRIGWVVHAYFHKTRYDVDNIMKKLCDLQCNADVARKAFNNLMSDSLDMGLCYSNYQPMSNIF